MRKATPVLLLATLAWFYATIPSRAATYYVSTGGDDGSGDGSQGLPWATVQHAVSTVAGGSEIRIGEGTYSENVSIPATANTLTLHGGYSTNDWSWDPAGHPTVIKAASAGTNVVTYLSQSNTVIGVTLTGGAIGLYAEGNTLLPQCQFLVSHCIITNNTGDGIYLPANRGKNGLFAKNCLIAGNNGNGVRVNTSGTYEDKFLNCTIADNAGHGYHYDNSGHLTARLKNCIVADNGGIGLYIDNTDIAYVGNSCLFGNTGGDISGSNWRIEPGVMTADPVFVGGGDYHLQSGSPCIDYGTDLSGSGVTDDLELTARSAPYDMGCYQSANTAATRHAATYADAARANDSGAGTSWATAKKTIGGALAITAVGGTCNVAAGSYAENLALPQNVTLAGTNRQATIVSGAYYKVAIPGTGGTVRGLTLTGGDGGVIITGGETNNVIENCILRGSTYGIYAPSVGINRRFSVVRCILTNLTSTAIFMPASGGKGAVNARNCLIADNGGDGIFVQMNSSYASYVYNCTIANNAGSGWQDEATSHRTTYYKNSIITDNGEYGIRHKSGYVSYVQYCDVNGNTSGDYSSVDPNDIEVVTGVLSVAPGFEGGGDYHLAVGSLCIDAGEDLTGESVTNDLDGVARTDPYDMGCYESAFAGVSKYLDTYVDISMTNDSGVGTNWATAKKTIGAGLAITDVGGACHVTTGLYEEAVALAADVTLEGIDPDTTVISNAGTVVSIPSTNTTLRGFTVTGGVIGIYIKGGGLDDILIENCLIRGNGTGISAREPSISHRYIVNRCRIVDNTGIGIDMNVGSTGDGALAIYNSLVAGNGADGICIREASPYESIVYACTIVDNGGHGYTDESGAHKTTRFKNCIVSGNGGYGIRHTAVSINYVYNCCIYGNAVGPIYGSGVRSVGGNIAAYPMYTGVSDYRLLDGSPCVDTGLDLSGAGVTNDLAGTARSAPHDMGCYESAFAALAVYAATYANAGQPDDTGAGTSWATAKKTIGSALAVTAAGGTCHVTNGSYAESIFLPANITVEGGDRDAVRVSSTWFIVDMPGTNSTIRRLTLHNGLWGVHTTGTGLDTKLIDECSIVSNTYGIADFTTGSGQRFAIERSIVSDSTSHGIYMNVSTVGRGALAARNCLIARNGGDGIYILMNSVYESLIYHCTLADNGGSGYHDYANSHKTTYFTNCIVTGNGAYGIAHNTASQDDYVGYSCVVSNTLADFWGARLQVGDGMITGQPPAFAPDSYTLSEGSPCIDAGIDVGVTDDLLGVLRPAQRGFDMGAYESDPPPRGTVFLLR